MHNTLSMFHSTKLINLIQFKYLWILHSNKKNEALILPPNHKKLLSNLGLLITSLYPLLDFGIIVYSFRFSDKFLCVAPSGWSTLKFRMKFAELSIQIGFYKSDTLNFNVDEPLLVRLNLISGRWCNYM